MLLFLELFTAGSFLVCLLHAVAIRGRDGLWFLGALLGLGLVRENFVALYRLLYEYGEFTLQVGFAPVIGAVIWGYSIYLAMLWAERVTGDGTNERRHSSIGFLFAVVLFMMALACFYEPFLKLMGMARWQDGTQATGDVPWIALVGYPTLTIGFFLAWDWAVQRADPWLRAGRLVSSLLPLALFHALGLQLLKNALGW